MAEALINGMLTAGVASSDDFYATDILADRQVYLKTRYGIRVGADNADAAAWGSIVILAVEPQVLGGVLDQIRSSLQEESLVISVAAGYPIARIAARLISTPRVVRAMPNTPSGVLQGMTALAFAQGLPREEMTAAGVIFESVGRIMVVEEHLMDAVTGLSGSGPAYVYVMIEALADGGVKMGLPREVAELLAAQAAFGAARMFLESGEHPGRLKDRVTSPAGTTAAGIHKLEQRRLRAILMSAVEEAAKRSRELGCPA